ncbi:uncharacterized protein TNCV_5035031 [Trichonephila clavipes]|nr:uncharacterized protein TNCV_5035031 [Trichonephila clavipes]
MLRNPDRPLKNTDKRMVYIYNMFFVKKDFTFDFRTVKSGEIHLIQTTYVPMLNYEFPSSSLRCPANPNLFRRSFEPFDQMLYHRMVLEPHTAYQIPAGTRYILLTVQKTLFGFDIIPEMILPQLMENGFILGDFRKRKRFDQKAYKLPLPTPAHVPAETNKRLLDQHPRSFSKKNRVFITPVTRPPVAPVLISRTFTAFSTPQPVSIPEPPELTTCQIPDPPAPISPELTTSQIHLPPQPPELTTSQIHLPDPQPEQTTPQILLPDPPPKLTTSQILLPDPHLSRQHLRSFYQIHLWSRLWSRPLRMTLPWIKSCRPYLETICRKGFPRLIPKILRCWTRCLPCLTRVMISSRSWTI